MIGGTLRRQREKCIVLAVVRDLELRAVREKSVSLDAGVNEFKVQVRNLKNNADSQ